MDPDLPFYYYTSSKSRYYEGDLPEFSIAGKEPRPSRPPQREILGSTGHVTLTTRGKGTIRTRFHKQPVELPPPPGASVSLTEHSYASAGPSRLT